MTFSQKHPLLKDILSIAGFMVAVVVGTFVLNSYVFRSYNVVGGSMENTLHQNDRILVNRLPVTWAHLKGEYYKPNRGEIIVFLNPYYTNGGTDQYIIKRVIAYAGERVTVKDGALAIYNDEHPEGFRPDFNGEPKKYTSGDVDTVVPEGEVFVSGDNREGSNSYDSRNGLGTIPLYDIIGPAGIRIFPLNQIRTF